MRPELMMLNRRSLVHALVMMAAVWMVSTTGVAGATVESKQPAAETIRQFTAKAHSLKTGQLIYTVAYEEHWKSGSWTKRVMTASDLQGKVFLVRTLLPDTGFRTPKLEMVNERLKFKISAERVGKKIVTSRTMGEGLAETAEFDDDASLVIPGGLVAMIRAQWDILQAGKSTTWRMVAPGRLDWFSVRVRSGGIHPVGKRQALRVIMEPDSWLARLLVDELIFDIDIETRALARYKGVGMYSHGGEEPEPIELLFDDLLPNVPPPSSMPTAP